MSVKYQVDVSMTPNVVLSRPVSLALVSLLLQASVTEMMIALALWSVNLAYVFLSRGAREIMIVRVGRFVSLRLAY